jgi:hypothetical protein
VKIVQMKRMVIADPCTTKEIVFLHPEITLAASDASNSMSLSPECHFLKNALKSRCQKCSTQH